MKTPTQTPPPVTEAKPAPAAKTEAGCAALTGSARVAWLLITLSFMCACSKPDAPPEMKVVPHTNRAARESEQKFDESFVTEMTALRIKANGDLYAKGWNDGMLLGFVAARQGMTWQEVSNKCSLTNR